VRVERTPAYHDRLFDCQLYRLSTCSFKIRSNTDDKKKALAIDVLCGILDAVPHLHNKGTSEQRIILMNTKYHSRIYVTLRPSVLDPAGVAVESGLKQLGYETVEGIRIGKYIELTLSAASEAEAREQLDRMCDRLLANPVIENYRFELLAN
jgi:phosphoribosylformylglycinamidine synthase subunit PurS